MFMSHVDNDDVETLFTKSKKTAKSTKKPAVKAMKKASKSLKKSAPKNVVKAVKPKAAKVKAANPAKSSTKKASKPKNVKPKTYKISGSFTLDSEGNVLKQTKSISSVNIKDKLALVQFLVKTK